MTTYVIPDELKPFISDVYAAVAPSYSLNDQAHNLAHALDICHRALAINDDLNMQLDLYEIAVAALAHDMFSWTRSNHDEMVYHWIMTLSAPWIDRFRPNQIERIALAAKEHRSSYIGRYSSRLSELVATADRDPPTDKPERLLIRALEFRGQYLTRPIALSVLRECIEHVKEKYGTKTARKFPQLWLNYYQDSYVAYRQGVDIITVESAMNGLGLMIDKDK